MLEIIDKYLQKWKDLDLQKLPDNIEPEMAEPNQDPSEEWRIWKAIPSKVTDTQLDAFEERIGHKLPHTFREFLKHKHFYELQISECNFCSHPVNIWQAKLSEMIFEGYPRELLLDKGRIPFASWSDWGLLCFDTTVERKNSDYPIVLWDHEVWDQFEPKYENFNSMLSALDVEETRVKNAT